MPAILTWDEAGAVWDEPDALWDAAEAAAISWSLELWSLDGTTLLVAPAPFRTARVTRALEGPHAAEVELRHSDILAGDWSFGRRRLKIRDPDGTVRFHGWLERVARSGPPGDVKWTASAVGLAGAIDHGVVHGDATGDPDNDFDMEDTGPAVAWGLIQNAMAQDNNVWGFTLGTFSGGEGDPHLRHYDDGDDIRSAIDDLATLDGDGFDWDIDVDGNFNTWRPMRGFDRRLTHIFGADDTTDFEPVGDFSDAETYITAVGAPGHFATASDTADNIDERYGRREATVDFPDVADDDELLARAQDEIRVRRAKRRNNRATWIEGRGPWPFGEVDIGDAVFINEGDPFDGDLGPDGTAHGFRLTTITATFEPGTHVFIETQWERCWPAVEGLPEEP